MLLDPRLPMFVGITLTGALMWTLYEFAPSPGELSEPHSVLGPIQTRESCNTCHSEGGLSEGCLSCHDEIAAQFHDGRGYHSWATNNGELSCSECHLEHFGPGSPLVSDRSWGEGGPEAFNHPHVEFGLTGGHADLACADCHVAHRDEPFTLSGFPETVRTHTYLGLTQTCGACHDDPHAGGWRRTATAATDRKRSIRRWSSTMVTCRSKAVTASSSAAAVTTCPARTPWRDSR